MGTISVVCTSHQACISTARHVEPDWPFSALHIRVPCISRAFVTVCLNANTIVDQKKGSGEVIGGL